MTVFLDICPFCDGCRVGVPSQRAYEARTGLSVRPNFAVVQAVTDEAIETHARRQGQALFELKDYRGRQGQKGRTYLAWQLPSSYVGQHHRRPKGRQKRINHILKNDQVMKGMPGNMTTETGVRRGKVPNEGCSGLEKVYYHHGKLAAKAHGRDPSTMRYWRWQETSNGRFVIWQQVGGQ